MAGVEDVLKSDAAQYQYDASKLTQTSAVSNKSDMTMDDFCPFYTVFNGFFR